jgi:hypothetical protein
LDHHDPVSSCHNPCPNFNVNKLSSGPSPFVANPHEMSESEGDKIASEWEQRSGPVGVAGAILDVQSNFGRSLSMVDGSTAALASSSVTPLGRSQSSIVLGTHRSSSSSQMPTNNGKTRSDRLKQAAAKTAAIYYGECYLEGVGVDTADEAARESHESYRKWWLQQFGNERLTSSFGDAHNVPRFNSPDASGWISSPQHPQRHAAKDPTDSNVSSHTGVTTTNGGDYKTSQDGGYFFAGMESWDDMSVRNVTSTQLPKHSSTKQPHHINHISADFKPLLPLDEGVRSTAILVSDYGTDDDHRTVATINESRGQSINDDTAKDHKLDMSRKRLHHVTIDESHRTFASSTCDQDDIYSIQNAKLPPQIRTAQHIENAKTALLHSLAISDGDVTTSQFLYALNQLRTLYNMTGWDARDIYGRNLRSSSKYIEGTWMTLSRPNYYECLGKNSSGEYMYTLGK